MITVATGVDEVRRLGNRWSERLELPSPITLCIDIPWGHALASLPSLPRPVLVVTANLSPYYLRDLLDLRPEGLVASGLDERGLRSALERIVRGESFYAGPPLPDGALSERERTALRLLAFGRDNAEISESLGISKQSVANLVTSLRERLGVRNRVEMSLAYLGVHDPLQATAGRVAAGILALEPVRGEGTDRSA